MPRTLVVLLTFTAALGLASCGSDRPGSSDLPTSGPASSPASNPTGGSPTPSVAAGTSIHVTIQDGEVTPNGERVQVKLGEPVTLHIVADAPGELHVHSTPEQQISFDKGTSTKRLTFEQPGIVDVEHHGLEQVIVQLQVS